MNLGTGAEAVSLARAAVTSEVTGDAIPCHPADAVFSEPSGAFVTLNTYPDHRLRGCIGYPMPVFPLAEAIERSARSACHDPRFTDLGQDELDRVTVEVTVLSCPERISGGAEEIEGSVVIGRDGLILELFGHRGLLLPQVPAEFGWDRRGFLEALSMKAGLPADAWMHQSAVISRFSGQIYHEIMPCGVIEEGE